MSVDGLVTQQDRVRHRMFVGRMRLENGYLLDTFIFYSFSFF